MVLFCSVGPGNVKAEAHAVILLAQVTNGLERAVAAHGSSHLKHLQEVLALEGESQPVGRAGDVGIGREEHGLEPEGACRGVIGVGAAQGDTLDLAGKLVILGKLELGVLGTDAHIVIDGLQFLLAVLGGDGAASFSLVKAQVGWV